MQDRVAVRFLLLNFVLFVSPTCNLGLGWCVDNPTTFTETTKSFFKLDVWSFTAAGAAMSCAHSKGALSRCLVIGATVAKDVGKGLEVERESVAAGSCFGNYVVGCCYAKGAGVAQDSAEAARLYGLAATHGYLSARNHVGLMFRHGEFVAQGYAEALRLYCLGNSSAARRAPAAAR
jgi:TPR repeat protein